MLKQGARVRGGAWGGWHDWAIRATGWRVRGVCGEGGGARSVVRGGGRGGGGGEDLAGGRKTRQRAGGGRAKTGGVAVP